MRADRRRQEQLAKIRAKMVMKELWNIQNITDKGIGRNASVHCRGCACRSCQSNNRKSNSKNDRTIAEIKANESLKEQLEERD